MLERRPGPVLGALACLMLMLTIWQISPRELEQKLPYDSDDESSYNAIDALPPGVVGYAARELNSHGGTSGTYLTNLTKQSTLFVDK